MTEDSDRPFPTFCHISEYGDEGYANLHRMLAISQPLVLWAPSSAGILASSQIDAKMFVGCLEDGLIRIQAREQWITDKRFRADHKFVGARWNESIDGPIRSIYENDLRVPAELRRVAAAPPEQGWQKADAFLAEHDAEIARWSKVLRGRKAAQQLPVGIIESAKREAGKARSSDEVPLMVARAILRDAFNHGEAFRQSGANVPFLLASADRQFLELIRQSESDRPMAMSLQPSSYDSATANLADQLLEVLRHLDIRRGHGDINKFIRGDGKRLLATWLNDVCDVLKRTEARVVDRRSSMHYAQMLDTRS